jgi:hypothetical protein
MAEPKGASWAYEGKDAFPESVLERQQIDASEGKATRHGATLSLATDAGPVLLISRDQCGDDGRDLQSDNCHFYYFIAHDRAHHGYLVEVRFYEGGKAIWIDDRTGLLTMLDRAPHFSPSGARFIVTSGCVAYQRTLTTIWRSDDQTLEWQHGMMSMGPYGGGSDGCFEFVAWASETEIRVDRIVFDIESPSGEKRSPARLLHDGSTWQVR